jgi:hypothetical protein
VLGVVFDVLDRRFPAGSLIDTAPPPMATGGQQD